MQVVDTISVLAETVATHSPIIDPAFWDTYSGIIAAFVGTVLGFMIGEGNRWFREWRRIKRLKKMIVAELRAIQSQIPQKQELLCKMAEALGQNKILDGNWIRATNTGYRQHIAELYEHLSPEQRNCLHAIHEALRIGDQFLEEFEELFIARKELWKDVPGGLQRRCTEMTGNYRATMELIDSYIRNDPKDGYQIVYGPFNR